MEATTWQRVKEIFGEAVERGPAEQASFVRTAAAGDENVEREVLRLLQLQAEPDARLDHLQPQPGLLDSAGRLQAFFAGETLAGRYRVRRFLAQGGMGEVYEAEDLELGERIALKTLRADLAAEERLIALRREIKAARKISHPNIGRIFDLVQTETAGGRPLTFLTMELLEGETLLERLRREGPMTERQALPLVRQMVAALTAAHEAGIVHRDFKAGNVMIMPRPEGPVRVVVTDFGLAGAVPRETPGSMTLRSRQTLFTAGTPTYMAPEQIEGKRAGPAADVYALGVVLYEMVTGELPYAEESPMSMAVRKARERPRSPASLAPTLRPNWTATILWCLDPVPRRRPAGAREVLASLDSRSRAKRWLRIARRPRYRWLRGAAAMVLAGALLAGLYRLLPVRPDTASIEVWQQGVWALHAGEPVVAARRLEQAIGQGRLPVEARAHLAQAWVELGFADRAARELNAVRFQPLKSESAAALVDAVRQQQAGHWDAARKRLEQRLGRVAPELRAMALADLAALDEKLGKPEAPARWRQVLQADPQNAAAHFRLAGHQARAGEERQAEQSFLAAELYWRARGDQEMLRRVSAQRGLARLAAGRFDEARNDLPSLSGLLRLPSGAGYAPCEHVVEVMAGVPDNFAPPYDPVYVNPDMRAHPVFPRDGHLKQFDEQNDDVVLFASLPLPAMRLCSGVFETRIRCNVGNPGRMNDTLRLGVAPLNGSEPLTALTSYLWSDRPEASERLFGLDLSGEFLRAVQYHSKSPTSPYLDLSVGDDTTVDYVKLTLVY